MTIIKRATLARAAAVAAVLSTALTLSACGETYADLKTGDCASANADNVLEPVDCESDKAEYEVIDIEEGVSETESGLFTCSDVKKADTGFWVGEDGDPSAKTGTMFCVKTL